MNFDHSNIQTLKMALLSFPTPSFRTKLISHSLPFGSYPGNSYNPSLCEKQHKKACGHRNSHSTFPYKLPIERSFRSWCTGSASDAESSAPVEEDHNQALETVLKLHSAVKKKNLGALSDIIADECRCACNFFSAFQVFQGKKQVLEFFSDLVKNLGNNIEFVVSPAVHDGMTVGIQWRLEWKNTKLPLGKGFSFYFCHIYQGKVLISNMEMFMDPLLRIEPLLLKTIAFLTAIMEKLSFYWAVGGKRKKVDLLLSLFFLALSLFFFQLSLY